MATVESILKALKEDTKIKLAAIDADGVLRGKLISKDKFVSSIKADGLGWCSVVFGWVSFDLLNLSTSIEGLMFDL